MSETNKTTELKENFIFYFWNSPSCQNSSTSDNTKKTTVGPFSTAEEFWGIYQYMKRPSVLAPNVNFCLFKKNVQPIIEDPENQNGGKFKFSLKKNENCNKIWEDLLILLIISDERLKKLNGIYLQSFEKCVEISLWTSHLKEMETACIEEVIKENLDDNICIQIEYQGHSLKVSETVIRYRNSDDKIDVCNEERRRDIAHNMKRFSVNEGMKFEGFKDALDNQKLKDLLDDMESID